MRDLTLASLNYIQDVTPEGRTSGFRAPISRGLFFANVFDESAEQCIIFGVSYIMINEALP